MQSSTLTHCETSISDARCPPNTSTTYNKHPYPQRHSRIRPGGKGGHSSGARAPPHKPCMPAAEHQTCRNQTARPHPRLHNMRCRCLQPGTCSNPALQPRLLTVSTSLSPAEPTSCAGVPRPPLRKPLQNRHAPTPPAARPVPPQPPRTDAAVPHTSSAQIPHSCTEHRAAQPGTRLRGDGPVRLNAAGSFYRGPSGRMAACAVGTTAGPRPLASLTSHAHPTAGGRPCPSYSAQHDRARCRCRLFTPECFPRCPPRSTNTVLVPSKRGLSPRQRFLSLIRRLTQRHPAETDAPGPRGAEERGAVPAPGCAVVSMSEGALAGLLGTS